ncbi:MAG TPA: phospholipase D-like domain-containing protein [Anaerolineales bacterium]|nr:phospholipase D-like domain-containing protein [Anaerolineales bacterium]
MYIYPTVAKIILYLLALIFVTTACTAGTGTLLNPTSTAVNSSWYTVYFTNPTSPTADSYRGGPDEALAAAIEEARLSVDMAVYDLNLWSIRDALIGAHRHGIEVRVVTDSDNMDELEIQELKEAGIEVLGDRREGLMHDKFVVIDRSVVWTGSMNFTTGGGYLDNNNLIRIQSSQLADDYTVEFEQMFEDDHFGGEKTSNTPHPNVTINGSLVEAYFSPQDGTLDHILAVIHGAQENISFLAYSFTSDELAQALIERAQAGVAVQGVFDEDQYHSNEGTEFDRLKSAGVDVRLDGNPRLMHHKVILIDGQVVITGSYNFSNNAEHSNDENTLIIHNQDIASQYLAEFQQIFSEAQR